MTGIGRVRSCGRGDLLGRLGQLGDRGDDAAGDEPAETAGERDAADEQEPEHEPQLREHVVDSLERPREHSGPEVAEADRQDPVVAAVDGPVGQHLARARGGDPPVDLLDRDRVVLGGDLRQLPVGGDALGYGATAGNRRGEIGRRRQPLPELRHQHVALRGDPGQRPGLLAQDLVRLVAKLAADGEVGARHRGDHRDGRREAGQGDDPPADPHQSCRIT